MSKDIESYAMIDGEPYIRVSEVSELLSDLLKVTPPFMTAKSAVTQLLQHFLQIESMFLRNSR